MTLSMKVMREVHVCGTIGEAPGSISYILREVLRYCTAAKRFLDQKKLPYTEISFDSEPSQLREEVVEATHHRTVPVIFDLRTEERIFIGGFDELNKYPL